MRLDKSGKLPIYGPGKNITVHFEGSFYWISINKEGGWVGLVPSETEHKSSDAADKVALQHYYLRSEFGKLTFKAPSKSGLYDIRMFDSDPGFMQGDGLEVASVSFKVGKKKNDLNGIWKCKDRKVLISQIGSTINSKYFEVPQNFKNTYGFDVNDRDFNAETDGKTINGSIFMRFPLEYKQKCPQQWKVVVPIEFSISKDGNKLNGNYMEYIISSECEVRENGLKNIEYERVLDQN